MPRKDRTFSSSDLIRLARNNLSNQELADVLLDLCLGVKIEDFGQGPVLVPLTSAEEALEEQDIVDIAVDIISGRVIQRLPALLDSQLGISISDEFLRPLLLQAMRR